MLQTSARQRYSMVYIYRKFISNDKRTALVRKNILLSFFVKGWSALVQFLMVPLTLKCLGNYENGIWLTISAILLWIDNLDIGLGNGLRNKIAEYMAKDDILSARKAVSSTFFMLILLMIPIAVVLNTLIANVDLYTFLNVDKSIVGNLNGVFSVSIMIVCSTFIFKFIGNVYMGLQLPAINNIIVTSGQTLSLVITFAVYLLGEGSLLMIAIINTLSPLLIYLISYPITFSLKYKELRPNIRCVNTHSMKELFDTGIKFFILQIASMLLFMSSNIIISKYYSPAMVTPYQVTYRYFCVIILLFSIICIPYWSATTDAYQKGDRQWMMRADKTLNKILLYGALLAVVMVIVSKWIYLLWVGSQVQIPFEMTVLMAAYIMVLVISTRYSYILNGIGALNLQLLMTVGATVAYVVLSVFIAHYTHNINYLLLLMCAVNMPGLIVNYIQYKKILNGTANGIWQM